MSGDLTKFTRFREATLMLGAIFKRLLGLAVGLVGVTLAISWALALYEETRIRQCLLAPESLSIVGIKIHGRWTGLYEFSSEQELTYFRTCLQSIHQEHHDYGLEPCRIEIDTSDHGKLCAEGYLWPIEAPDRFEPPYGLLIRMPGVPPLDLAWPTHVVPFRSPMPESVKAMMDRSLDAS